MSAFNDLGARGHARDRTVRPARLGGALLAFIIALLAASAAVAQFEPTNQDIDLFMINPGSSTDRLNVLILLDNTANWNQPFAAEKTALTNVVSTMSDQLNVGLMLFPETGSPNDNTDGGYVRFGVRQMTSANKDGLSSLISGLDKLADKGNNATFSLLMYEAYAYYAGITARSGFGKVKRDYQGNPSNPIASALPGSPLSSVSDTTYTSPITSACQKNYIIIISNGPATDNSSSLAKAQTLLTGIQGSAPTQINIPAPNDGEESNWTDEYARYMSSGDCNPNIDGTQRVNTYTIEVDPGTTKSHLDHTALMKSTATYGKGRYFAVGTHGGADGTELADALESILTEIKAVNSVFASSTLPVSVNVRGTNANQVYMGVFRPDASLGPRWLGNMKLYRIGRDDSVSPPEAFLADANGKKAESGETGFVVPQALSFWTRPSTFWAFRGTYEDTDLGRESDAPDGPYVEKGGSAQQQRGVAPADRKLYTCAGGCSSGQALSDSPFASSNSAITAAALGASSSTERSNIIAWTRGQDLDDENANGSTTDARASIQGDVLHSRPAVINYNRSGLNDDNDVFVFYGANDGVLRAVQGGVASGGGQEAWGFIAPEHFGKLKRLRENTPIIRAASKKPYFFDGVLSTYTHDVNGDGKLVAASGDKVLLFAGMRRGGRYVYAFDVSDPVDPKFLWKKGCPNESGNAGCDSGYEGLGQTWSDPTVAFLRAYGNAPMLVMGAGYDDAVEDIAPCLTTGSSDSSVTTTVNATVTYNLDGSCSVSGGTSQVVNRTMGRGVLIIDAFTGEVKKTIGSEPNADIPVSGMSYSIAGEVVALNRDRDLSRPTTGIENVIAGYTDRLYASDTGGNIWRVDVADADDSKWTVHKLAALGGGGVTPRRFLHRVDVVYGKDANGPYDAVEIGSGDREHPFDRMVQNRFYMIKDRDVAARAPTTYQATVSESTLFDATSNCLQQCSGSQLTQAQASLLNASGWYIDLAPGEKSVGAATTVAGIIFFNTNQPTSSACASTLGIAREYQIKYADATAARDVNVSNTLTIEDRAIVHAGGGMLPDPVAMLVQVDSGNEQGQTGTGAGGNARLKTDIDVCTGPHCTRLGTPPIGTRLRTFWHKLID